MATRNTLRVTSKSTSTAYTAYRNTSVAFIAYRNSSEPYTAYKPTDTTIAGPLPSSGTITLQQVRDVFLMTGAASLSDFYGMGKPSAPPSGNISLSDFYGVSNVRSTSEAYTAYRTTSVSYVAYRNSSEPYTAYKSTTTVYNTTVTTEYFDGLGGSCFPAETPVHMADGMIKAICDVRVGDVLLNGYGDTVTVLGYDRPKIGHRPIHRINKDFYNTPEHLTWTKKGWAVVDMDAYLKAEYRVNTPVTDDEGNSTDMLYVGVDPKNVCEYTVGDEIGFRGDYKVIDSLEEHFWHPETQLYALVTTGSRTFMVGDGYVVSGWANDEEFDYTNFG